MSYRKLYNNIITRLTPEEASLLDAVFREELKAIRRGDIEGAENRLYFYVNRNFCNKLNFIKSPNFFS